MCRTSASVPIVSSPATVVTECWIEGCCFARALVSLDAHIAFRPLSISLPIEGADKLLIHLTGFSGDNSVYLKRLLKALGLKLAFKLNRECSHLVCSEPVGLKYDKAVEWGIEAVKDEWLFAVGRSGIAEGAEPFRHHPSHDPSRSELLEPSYIGY